MHLTDTHWVPANVEQTWKALRDPAVLRRCIAGCADVRKLGDTEYAVALDARLGGSRRHFDGRILITDETPPHTCHIAFEGLEAHAGLALGDADIRLEAAPQGGTRIRYALHAATGGPLAAIEPAVLERVGRGLVEDFFTAFADQMTVAPPTLAPATADGPTDNADPAGRRLSWVFLGALVLLTIYYMFLR